MVKTESTLWLLFTLILWHFLELALRAGKLTEAVKWPFKFQNPRLAFPDTRKTGSAPSFSIVHFDEIIGNSRHSPNSPGAILLPKWQKAMLFISSDFLIFGNTFEVPNRIFFTKQPN